MTAEIANRLHEMDSVPDGAFGAVAYQLFWELGPYNTQMWLPTEAAFHYDDVWKTQSDFLATLKRRTNRWGVLGFMEQPIGPLRMFSVLGEPRSVPSRLSRRLDRMRTASADRTA